MGKELWKKFDVDGTGQLSLAKIDKGLRDAVDLPELFGLEPVEIRAYHAACKRAKKKNKYSADFVQPQDFRYLLKYLYVYYEYWVAFEKLDKDGDHRIPKSEFIAGKDLMTKWGIDMSDPDKVWAQIDPHRHQHALFEEFADYAIKNHIDDYDSDEEKQPGMK